MRTETIDVATLLGERDWLRRLARGLTGDPAFAEDAVQETYLAALRHPPRVQGGSIRGWLATVLRHRLANHARHGRRRERLAPGAAGSAGSEPMAAVADQGPGPEALTAQLELQRLVAALVLELPAPQREALLLCTAHGLTSTEAATRLGVPAGTVRWRVKQALDLLRADLDRQHGGDRRAWRLVLAPIAAEPLAPAPRRAAPSPAEPPAGARAKVLPAPALLAGAIGLLAAATAVLIARGRPPESAGGRSISLPVVAGAPTAATVPREDRSGPASATASLSGTVYDPSGRPVPGAVVGHRKSREPHELPASESPFPAVVVSDSSGRYRLPGLLPGRHTLTAASPLGAPAGATATVRADEQASLDLHLQPDGVLLEGHLRDHAAGPVAGGQVLLFERLVVGGRFNAFPQVLADGAGAFRVRLRRGTYHMLAAAPGYARVQLVKEVVETTTVVVPLVPEAILSGRVLAGGAAAAGAEVVLIESDGHREHARDSRRTGDDGQFRFDGLPPGTYRLSARRDALAGQSPARALALVERASVDIELTRALTLQGVVRDERGRALEGVTVVAVPEDGPGRPAGLLASEPSDRQGRYRIAGLAAGTFVPGALHPGYTSPVRSVALSNDTTFDLEFARAPVLSGIVRDSLGRPAADAQVEASVRVGPASSQGDRQRTDAAGRFRMTGLPAGRCNILAWSAGEIAQRVDLPLEAGRETSIELPLAPGAQVEGQVVDERGEPVPHIQIVAQGRAHPARHHQYHYLDARADGRGRFRVGPFLPGTASVVALAEDNNRTSSSVPRPEQQDLKVTAGQHARGARLVVMGRSGVLGGRVLDPDGRPLADARLWVIQAEPARPPRKHLARGSVLPVISDAEGRFRATDLRGPRQVVWVEHAAHPDLRADDVATGTTDLRLVMQRGGRLEGVLVRADGQPVPEYELLVAPAAVAAETANAEITRRMNRTLPSLSVRDPGGRFAVDRLEGGAYELMAVAPGPGLQAQLASVEVAAGRTRAGLRMIARPGLAVRGRVVDRSGRPAAADVAVLQIEGYRQVRTGGDGRFELRGLAPLERLLRVQAQGVEDRRAQAHVDRAVSGDVIDLGVIELSAPPR